MSHNRGPNSTGGALPRSRPDPVNDRDAPYDAPPSTVDLLRAIWAKRDRLEPRTRGMIHAFLQRVQRYPLTGAQLDAAVGVGRSLGIGYDDPAYDSPCRVPAPQPWGPLPKKPPGRAA